jgi:hypothetical protein
MEMVAKSLIKEEGAKLDSMIKESYSKRDFFLKKTDHGNYSMTPKFLKDPLI